jgi:hypothetical protein
MKKYLLAAAVCALAAPAYANSPNKCTSVAVPGQNLVQLQCDSDNQISDGDDLDLFLDKQSGLQALKGSLNKNTSIPADQNLDISVNLGTATISQQGNGFAEMKSSLQGSPLNDLRSFTFSTIAGSTIDGQNLIFQGFDGFMARGQVDPTGQVGVDKHGNPIYAWDGDVFMHIVFADNSTQNLTFLGDTAKDDFGALGFDEPNEPGKLISRVTISLDNTGAFNELKQIKFSVPSAVAGIPEPSTWAMMLGGFGLIGLLALRKRRLPRFAV